MMISRVGLAGIAVLTLLVAGTAGVAGLAYLLVWALVSAPGVPLAFRLCGRHGFAVTAGLCVGYTTSCLVVWLLVMAGWTSPLAFVTAWAIESGLLLAAARVVPAGSIPLSAWTSRDTAGLALTLLLVPALMGAPYRHLGAQDAGGTRYYRAYFTADFLWHAALTAEVGRFTMPPRNPYVASEPLHYYWTYFLVPAAATSRSPIAVETALKVNAECTAVLLIASIYLLAWAAGVGPGLTALAVALVVIAASAEGTYAIYDFWKRGVGLAALRDINVDAVTAWKFAGLRIDGVHRTMFYTPQHGLSCSLGLLALTPAAVLGAEASIVAVAAIGVLLGLATVLNPFLGAAFCAIYGVAILADAARLRIRPAHVSRHAIAAVPPLLAIGWGLANSMGEGAGNAIRIGWYAYARNAPIVTLLLSLGPALVPALVGLFPTARLPTRAALVGAAGIGVGLFLLYFVVLTDLSWVSFRAGQILLALMPLPLARLLARLRARSAGLVAALATLILLAGAPTTIADTFNAQDIGNLAMGPGFPWTVTLSPAVQEGVAWVRTHTTPRQIVQVEPIVRGREQWSFIPTFAGRRMAAGLPISLLPAPIYEDRSRQVQSMFQTALPPEAHTLARRLRIDYLWVDAHDRRAYPEGVARLDGAPDYFERVFQNAEVTIYRVR
jgi:hypothetical protein